MTSRRSLVLWSVLVLTATATAQEKKPVSFITDVAPILKENCFACHDAKKRSGKYDMTTFEKLTAGGSGGEAVAAGKLEDSELHALMVTKDERRMPPRDKGEAVPAEKAAVVAEWIKQGAKLDAGIDPKADLLKELRVRWKPPTPPAKFDKPVVVNAIAFTPDGKSLVVGGHYELTVWNAADGKLQKRLHTRSERAYALAFLSDGKLAVAGSRPGQEGDVRVYDLSAKPVKSADGVDTLDGVNDPKVLVKHLIDTEDSILCLAVSPDGKKLAAGGCDRAIRVWDISGGTASAKLEQTIENHADWVLGVAMTADGKYLVSASRDKTSKVWDLKAKESVMTFPDHQNTVFAVGLKADGSVGYSVGADRQVRTWKPGGDGKQMKNSGAHGDDVFKIALHPKDPLFVTCSADKSVRVWDADKLSNTKTLTGLTDFVYAVAFSPDGEKVAGGSFAGEVAVWGVKDKNDKPVLLFNATPGYQAKK